MIPKLHFFRVCKQKKQTTPRATSGFASSNDSTRRFLADLTILRLMRFAGHTNVPTAGTLFCSTSMKLPLSEVLVEHLGCSESLGKIAVTVCRTCGKDRLIHLKCRLTAFDLSLLEKALDRDFEDTFNGIRGKFTQGGIQVKTPQGMRHNNINLFSVFRHMTPR